MSDVKNQEPVKFEEPKSFDQLRKLFGLFAMFGVDSKGQLPKYRANASSSHHSLPQSEQDELIKKAALRRARRNLVRPGRYASSTL